MRHTIYLKNDAQLLVVRAALREYQAKKQKSAIKSSKINVGDKDSVLKYSRVLQFIDETIQVVDCTK